MLSKARSMARDTAVRRTVRAVASAIAPAPIARGRGLHATAPRRGLCVMLIAGALAWLLVGCCGLLGTIAFTADPQSMTIGLAVWVFGFVVPTIVATVIAYRLEEQAADARARRRTPRARGVHIPAGAAR
jgi:hypothetical protein